MWSRRRPRRLRLNQTIRDLAAETALLPDDLVAPLFVVEGKGVREPIPSMPGVFHLSADELPREAESLLSLGVRAVLLFGVPDDSLKDAEGSYAWREDGLVQRAVRELKARLPEVWLITDVCLCSYTEHGHCGLLDDRGAIDDERTCEVLSEVALSHAAAGADMVAPSDMMDGRVGFIRDRLDEAGFGRVGIMAYSAKYASCLYGPFREAAHSAPRFGDRRSYQMDPRNAREALVEVALDVEEGADVVMVKPALFYLDVVRAVRERFDLPLAAYSVSGEYAMVKRAIEGGLLPRAAILELLTSVRRAGADLVITYFAAEAASMLREGWR